MLADDVKNELTSTPGELYFIDVVEMATSWEGDKLLVNSKLFEQTVAEHFEITESKVLGRMSETSCELEWYVKLLDVDVNSWLDCWPTMLELLVLLGSVFSVLGLPGSVGLASVGSSSINKQKQLYFKNKAE